MPPSPSVHVGVCAVVVRNDLAIGRAWLMLKRAGSGEFASDGAGTYSWPGGWMELGETPEQTAIRECLEETDVRCKARARLGYVCCPSDNGKFQIVTLVIGCSWQGGAPRNMEPDKASEVLWVPVDHVPNLPLFNPVKAWLAQSGGRTQ